MPDRIVVDVGCADQGDGDSIATLVSRYDPTVVYGFDPLLDENAHMLQAGGPVFILERKAAWTRAGTINLGVGAGGLNATVVRQKSAKGEWNDIRVVECFDLAELLARFDPSDWVCLKLDVEGAEFALLEHLVDTGAIAAVDELLVEWHDHLVTGTRTRKAALLEQLPEVKPWV